jgi:hypothetical protein
MKRKGGTREQALAHYSFLDRIDAQLSNSPRAKQRLEIGLAMLEKDREESKARAARKRNGQIPMNGNWAKKHGLHANTLPKKLLGKKFL